MELFERASRERIRFESRKGLLSVEDLWQLPLTKLNDIAVDLHKKVEASGTITFIETRSKENKTLQLKLDIAKHIIQVKLTEKEARNQKLVIAEKKAKIKELIEKKQDEALGEKSLEDLQKELEGLG